MKLADKIEGWEDGEKRLNELCFIYKMIAKCEFVVRKSELKRKKDDRGSKTKTEHT
jgi:hypothetical protein